MACRIPRRVDSNVPSQALLAAEGYGLEDITMHRILRFTKMFLGLRKALPVSAPQYGLQVGVASLTALVR